ncbi:hypothetical protein [Dyadobacter arcticus]|uniref:Lipocalin-like domain-containing protein n=1 Tax=Dyadobacter arcticus TaxID=1078754 RepID=A0ABX0UMW4_9BACT|nr:hypothetical protein [Dyadobacter arcticus]NIJ53020.1 hypothetical protein [Dyadobacter arcticus]
MKKLIFCCLVVLMGSCKDKDETVEPETDFAPEFAGNYETTTVVQNVAYQHSWQVTTTDKNKLAIVYIKTAAIEIPGTTVDFTQEYNLVDVKTTGKDVFVIDETVDVKQSNEKASRQRVEGTGNMIVNSKGVPQINITVKLTEVGKSTSVEEYLEFKKK